MHSIETIRVNRTNSATVAIVKAVLSCFFIVSLLLVVGCSSREPQVTDTRHHYPVCIVCHPNENAPHPSLTLLHNMYPQAQVFSAHDFDAATKACRKDDLIMIIPEVATFPIENWQGLSRFTEQGGRVLFLGTKPFSARVSRNGEQWKSRTQHVAELIDQASTASWLPAIQAWRHHNSTGRMRGSVHIAHATGLPWSGVLVNCGDLEESDELTVSNLRTSALTGNANGFAFFARGDDTTSHLTLTCRDKENRTWQQVIRVSNNWAPYFLHINQFRCIFSGTNSTPLSLSNLRDFSVGLRMSVTPMSPGKHSFGISEFRVAHDTQTTTQVLPPNLPGISTDNYETTANELVATGQTQGFPVPAISIGSPLPLPRGLGGNQASVFRWIPLFRALDVNGETRGWPASVFVKRPTGAPAQRYGWVAVETTKRSRAAIKAMIDTCIRKLHTDTFLYNAGSEHYTIDSGKIFNISAKWSVAKSSQPPIRLVAQLLDQQGAVLRKATSPAQTGAGSASISLGILRAQHAPRNLSLKMTLEEIDSNGRILDELVQALKILPISKPLSTMEPLGTQGSHFIRGRRRVFLMGMNYHPVTASSFGNDWLSPGEFNPTAINADLKYLAKRGFNTIALSYTNINQASQLLYVLSEAAANNIMVVLHIPSLSPLSTDIQLARKLLMAAKIADAPQVCSIELAHNPVLDNALERKHLNAAWQSWLIKQYGSVAHAQDVLGHSLWHTADTPGAPPATVLTNVPAASPAIATYFRFLDDHFSRHIGYIKRTLRSMGCKQLLTMRYCTDDLMPQTRDTNNLFALDSLVGASHLDYFSLDLSASSAAARNFEHSGTCAVHARGVGGGKPVVWSDFRTALSTPPSEPELANQSRIYREMLNLVRKTYAAGCFALWFSQYNNSGLTEADGSLRPASGAYRTFARHLPRYASSSPPPWRGKTTSRILHDVLDIAAGVKTLEEIETQQTSEEVRLPYQGFPSTKIQHESPGGVSFTPPAPLVGANAEWNTLTINDRELAHKPGMEIPVVTTDQLKLELLNTGQCTWTSSRKGLHGTVWIRADHAEYNPRSFAIPTTTANDSTIVSWTPPYPGQWHLRAYLTGAGYFGEELILNVTQK